MAAGFVSSTGGGRGGPRLLVRLRRALRVRHYSRRTEEAYVGWALFRVSMLLPPNMRLKLTARGGRWIGKGLS